MGDEPLGHSGGHGEGPAHLVLRNGAIATVNPRGLRAEAVAIRGDRILAVGSNEEIEAAIGPSTQVIDLAGAFAMPGFIEGHGHLLGLGSALMQLDLRGLRSWAHVVAMVADAARAAQPGEWILGRGWHQDHWDETPQPNVGGLPLHQALSDATPDNPVLLRHASGHSVLANARAMALGGVTRDTADPPGGRVVRDPRGEPTGAFLDSGARVVDRALSDSLAASTPQQKEARLRRQIGLATQACLARGVTSFHDAGASFDTIELYRTLVDENALGLRLWVMISEDDERLVERLPDARLVAYGDRRLTVRAIKRLIDGALGTRTAWMFEPYADEPGNTGLCVTTPEAIEATCRLAVAHGMQMCVHAIGDRANRQVLDVYERVLGEQAQARDRRWRIEHAQHLAPDDVPRFARLGVVASMQGTHCTSDGAFAVAALGERRAREGAYAWRRLLDAGARVVNGTDTPVEHVDPIRSFHASVTRRLADGTAFFPEQCMTRAEALRSYTLGAAYAAFEEGTKGSLAPGKLADIVVLSRDLLAAPEDEILGTEVLHTIVGGQVVRP